jgi:NADH-quinone oxidoreductase subunit G
MSATKPTQADEEKQTVTVTVDGRDIEADPGELLIDAAEREGTYIPRFCYHPRMKPVGMCRMCLVNVEGPRGTSMQVSCMLTCSDGMKVDTQAPEVKKAQDGVLEFLLVNHPLDCPVCDKGGECPLQDQTLTFGPGETRFIEEKRHFEKPIEISPLVQLDRERCILCDRCTRFAKEVAGDPLIHFQDRGNATQVNTFPDHPFSSYFSGNTVQICPVGALTASTYRFKARPWDLEQVESTCTTCAFGERLAVQSSGDKITRYLGIDADPTNHGWLSDKCRFNFEALNSDERLTTPLMHDADGQRIEASWGDALAEVTKVVKAADAERVACIGGSRLANEDQYAWAKLLKGVIGTDHVDAQLGDGLPADVVLGVERATIDEACNARAVVLLAPDLKEELPVLFLRLRDAVVNKGLKIIEISPQPTSFTPLAAQHLGYRTGDVSAVVAALLGKTKGLSKEATGDTGGLDAASLENARTLLNLAGDVVVVFGRQNLAESSKGISEAVGLFAQHSNARFLPALRRGNVMGSLDMGLAPGVLPGRTSLDGGRAWFTEAWGGVPASKGADTHGILTAAANGDIDVLFLLGSDPLADFPDADLAQRALSNVQTVVSVDTLPNASVREADIVLPAAAFAERSGTTTNIEGRITRLGQKVTAKGVAWPDWVIASVIAQNLGGDLGFETLEDIWNEIEAVVPTHHGITLAALFDRSNADGIVAPIAIGTSITGGVGPEATDVSSGSSVSTPAPIDPVATPGIGEAEWQGVPDVATATAHRPGKEAVRPSANLPARLSHGVETPSALPSVDGYGVRLVSGHKLYDKGTYVQFSPHLVGLMRNEPLCVNPRTLSSLGITGETVRVRSEKGDIVVPLSADENVPLGVAVWPFNVGEQSASTLIDASQAVTNVRLEAP